MDMKETIGLTSEEVDVYFNYSSRIGPQKKLRLWGVLVTIVGLCLFGLQDPTFAIIGIVIGLVMFLAGRAGIKRINNLCPTDAQIDQAWEKLAEAREEEAYRASNYKKKDTIRDSDYIFVYPLEIPASTAQNPHYQYTAVISPNDHYIRRNYLDVVRLIYGEDQIMTFQETLCLTDGWDGLDVTKEYYWTDVAGIEMDQKENKFEILVGGRPVEYPLTGERDKSQGIEEREALKNYIAKAETVSNALRSLLRSKKKGK